VVHIAIFGCLRGLKMLEEASAEWQPESFILKIGRNVLTYVDDIIVKSTKQENHIADLQEAFANFKQAGLKLNLEKCVLG
jgi:hypothetical protein